MVEIPAEIKDIIRIFLQKLKESNINIQRTILFGSYAKSTNNEYSDIDLALVSDNFSGNPYLDNEKIRPAKFAASYNIDAHTFTKKEFDEINLFVKEILKNGIEFVE